MTTQLETYKMIWNTSNVERGRGGKMGGGKKYRTGREKEGQMSRWEKRLCVCVCVCVCLCAMCVTWSAHCKTHPTHGDTSSDAVDFSHVSRQFCCQKPVRRRRQRMRTWESDNMREWILRQGEGEWEYRHFVDLRFVYKLNTKTSYSWLTKPKTF